MNDSVRQCSLYSSGSKSCIVAKNSQFKLYSKVSVAGKPDTYTRLGFSQKDSTHAINSSNQKGKSKNATSSAESKDRKSFETALINKINEFELKITKANSTEKPKLEKKLDQAKRELKRVQFKISIKAVKGEIKTLNKKIKSATADALPALNAKLSDFKAKLVAVDAQKTEFKGKEKIRRAAKVASIKAEISTSKNSTVLHKLNKQLRNVQFKIKEEANETLSMNDKHFRIKHLLEKIMKLRDKKDSTESKTGLTKQMLHKARRELIELASGFGMTSASYNNAFSVVTNDTTTEQLEIKIRHLTTRIVTLRKSIKSKLPAKSPTKEAKLNAARKELLKTVENFGKGSYSSTSLKTDGKCTSLSLKIELRNIQLSYLQKLQTKINAKIRTASKSDLPTLNESLKNSTMRSDLLSKKIESSQAKLKLCQASAN